MTAPRPASDGGVVLLRACVLAADEMRKQYERCDDPCDHEDCIALVLYDATRAKLGTR